MHKMLIFQKINSLVQGGIALEEGIVLLLAKGGILKGRHCIGGFTAVGDASKHAFICQELPL